MTYDLWPMTSWPHDLMRYGLCLLTSEYPLLYHPILSQITCNLWTMNYDQWLLTSELRHSTYWLLPMAYNLCPITYCEWWHMAYGLLLMSMIHDLQTLTNDVSIMTFQLWLFNYDLSTTIWAIYLIINNLRLRSLPAGLWSKVYDQMTYILWSMTAH